MAERLRDLLRGTGLQSQARDIEIAPFTEEEEAILIELGYEKQVKADGTPGLWWLRSGKMVSKSEMVAALEGKIPKLDPAKEYELPFFIFSYDAKHKARLPVWDRFPVIIMTGFEPGGFAGINIHYIDQEVRMKILQEILKAMDSGGGAAQVIAMLSEFKEGYKKYLNTHVLSNKIQVPRSMWEEVFQTPGNFIYK